MFAEQIRAFRKKSGMTQAELAQYMGLSQQAVGKWETGRSSPDQNTLRQLADLFHVTVDSLLGRSEAGVAPWNAPTSEIAIPIIGTVKAGYQGLAFEEDYGTESASVKNPESYFYLLVRGESMEPRIVSGDLALIHQQPDVDSGDLAIVLVDGEEGTLKKVVKQPGVVILQPFNPKYQPQIFIGQEIERLTIVGKVVEIKSKW